MLHTANNNQDLLTEIVYMFAAVVLLFYTVIFSIYGKVQPLPLSPPLVFTHSHTVARQLLYGAFEQIGERTPVLTSSPQVTTRPKHTQQQPHLSLLLNLSLSLFLLVHRR